MKKQLNIVLSLLTIIFLSESCRKTIEVDTPANQLTTTTVFTDSKTATSALLNIYALFNNTIDGTFNPYVNLYSDDAVFNANTVQQLEYARSAVSTTNSANLTIWRTYYFVIYSCNSLIGQLQNSNGLPKATSIQLINEAKFLRAFANFYLVNLYERIPLITATDINETSKAQQTDKAEVYQKIIQDLTEAKNSLSISYVGNGKVRANKLAATALLARIYLYNGDWNNAETAASEVINAGIYGSLQPPANIFLANSPETILQFWTQNGFISSGPVVIPSSGKPNYSMSASLLSEFEAGDLRKTAWTKTAIVSGATYTYPFKYHNRALNTTAPEYLMALRLGEQYLIRAEARMRTGNIGGAAGDLNVIRKRAGLKETTATASDDLLTAILHERRTELFSEWGHRFLDLKRLKKADAIIGSFKPTWKNNTSLNLPIPQNEITYNSNLQQNAGY